MSLKGRDKEFRTPKTTYVDFKQIEMDRVLTMLFPRLKYDGYASRRPPRGGDLTVEAFLEDFLEHPEWFAGFDHYPHVVQRWIETDLLADDILRLLAYEPHVPRSVLVDYLKTLMAFHLGLYHLKLLQLLPKLV